MLEQEQKILEYLQEHHVGKENAVQSKQLEKKFGLTGRSLRRRIAQLRQNGFPICSDSNGYFLAEAQNEINDTVAWLNKFVTGVSNSRTALLFSTVSQLDTEVEIKIIVKGGRMRHAS